MAEKVFFLDQIYETDFLIDLHVLRPPESENHIFSSWSVGIMLVCWSLRACMYVCVYVISITRETNYSRNSKFGILHFYHMQTQTFYEDQTNSLHIG